MQVPDWWPEFLTLRPASDYQSRENPLQVDRIPPTELDLPTQDQSPEQNHRTIRRCFRLVMLLGLGFGLWEFLATTRLSPTVAEHLLFLAALAVFLYHDVRASRKHWALFAGLLIAYLILLAGVVRASVDFLTTPFLFLVATLALLRLADRMTELNLHLATTAPTPKPEAVAQRDSWTWRRLIFPLGGGPRGLEFYGLSLLIVLLPALLVCWYRPFSMHFPGLLVILCTFFVVLSLTLVLELVAAVWSRRRVLSVSELRQGLRSSLAVWFTYDRQDCQTPGVFKSPVGGHKQRRRMSLACLVLLTVAIAQMTSWSRASLVKWDLKRSVGPAFLYLRDRPVIPRADTRPEPGATESADIFADGSEFETIFADAPEPHDIFAEPHPAAVFADKEPPRSTVDSTPASPAASPPEPFAHPFGLPTQTGSYTEDQKAREQLVGLLLLGLSYLKFISVYSVIATAVVPGLLFRAALFAVTSRFVCLRLRRAPLPSDPGSLVSASDWDGIVERLRTSDNEIEQESLFLGVNAYDHTPVLVPIDVFREHAHILGDSGSGKTALGLAPLIGRGQYSIVVIDLKGDEMSLFEGARLGAEQFEERSREAARRNGTDPQPYPFHWFTSELGKNTFVFNPLVQSAFHGLSVSQKADILTSAMGLQYGSGYGESYYADSNAELVRIALRCRPDVASFAELADVLHDRQLLQVDQKLYDAASHVRSVVKGLAETPILNEVGPQNGSAPLGYDMADVFRSPQVLYFYLPSAIGTASNAEFARFVLYSLLLSAKRASPQNGQNGHRRKRTQVFLFIDEFQRIVSHNLELFLQQARSMDIGVILANQTLADLKQSSVNLIPSVRANCRFKQMFSVTDVEEQQDLSLAAGESVSLNLTLGQYFEPGLFWDKERGKAISGSEQSRSRLTTNDILLAGDHPQHSIVQIRRGAGYAQYGGLPFVLHSQFHINKHDYEDRQIAAWPDPVPGTVSPESRPQPPVPGPEDWPEIEGPSVLEDVGEADPGSSPSADGLQDRRNGLPLF